ncbi:MAG: autotransporter-associated beta strand repeat-containing protein [Planctomycetia bacterium]|nr:autotransporter-associated beta strand repeat-containing protein [Planctomycetia bacterium]
MVISSLFLFSGTAVQAETVSLTGSQDSTKSWLTATSWSNGAEPSADNDYVVGNGYTLRTPTDSAHTFGGKSLTLGDDTSSGILYLKTAEKGTVTINNLCLVNGTIQQAVSYTTTLEGNITVNGSGTIKGDPNSNNTRSLIVNAPISGSGTLTLDTPGQNHVIELNGNITGNDLTLAKTGSATLLLTGDSNIKSMTQHGGNSKTGTTILTETGSLRINNDDRGLELTNGATFIIRGGVNSIVSGKDYLSGVKVDTGSTLSIEGGRTLMDRNGGNQPIYLLGSIDISDGELLLRGRTQNSISFDNGSLTLSENGKLSVISGNIEGNGTFNFKGGTLAALNQADCPEWTFGGNSTTSNWKLNITTILGDGENGGTSTVEVSEGRAITFASAMSGTGTLKKTGTGTLTISGANTFTGGIELNAGTLKLANANAAGTGGITITGKNVTLDVGEAVVPLTIASTGTLSLDDMLTITDFTWDGTWLEGIASTTDLGFIDADNVNLGENVVLSLDILGFTPEDGNEFTILTADNYAVEDGFDWNTLLDESLLSNWNLKLVGNSVTLAYSNDTGVPEPATWVMLALGMVGIVGARRFRKA